MIIWFKSYLDGEGLIWKALCNEVLYSHELNSAYLGIQTQEC